MTSCVTFQCSQDLQVCARDKVGSIKMFVKPVVVVEIGGAIVSIPIDFGSGGNEHEDYAA